MFDFWCTFANDLKEVDLPAVSHPGDGTMLEFKGADAIPSLRWTSTTFFIDPDIWASSTPKLNILHPLTQYLNLIFFVAIVQPPSRSAIVKFLLGFVNF